MANLDFPAISQRAPHYPIAAPSPAADNDECQQRPPGTNPDPRLGADGGAGKLHRLNRTGAAALPL